MAKDIDIRKIRDALDLSQSQMAERLGVHQTTLSRWEQYGIPKHGAARKLIERIVAEAA